MMMRWERAILASETRESGKPAVTSGAADDCGGTEAARADPGSTPRAAILGVHPKKLQRMEAQGLLVRCEELLGRVRYAASDVERLASARRKES
jgi:hypothetical protein